MSKNSFFISSKNMLGRAHKIINIVSVFFQLCFFVLHCRNFFLT
ncbi:hypothetical protein EVA_20768 [gut metagenome]|uniref:Uncharacterized protein n=1 Tax=gut metagenome TaxID=749906 RepID=J9F8A3_9ZZZZ